MKPKASTPRLWWALKRTPTALPVLFRTRRDAEQMADPDERLYRVRVTTVLEVRKRPASYEGSPF